MYQNEKIVETKNCKNCTVSFSITDKDLEFYEKISPTFKSSPHGGKGSKVERGIKLLPDGNIKYLIPTPTLCPECRLQRRLSFRNEKKLYRRKCHATGKDIISMYSPDKPYIIWDDNYWHTNIDGILYGKEFDFSKTFFEQFDELLRSVPRPNLGRNTVENSDYTNQVGYIKDCYLVFEAGYSENCYYCNSINKDKNCVDCLVINGSENCYECVDCNNCYDVSFSSQVNNSKHCSYIVDGDNLNYCFLSHSLRNKSYYFENKALTKETYIEQVNNFHKLPKQEQNTKIREWKNHIIKDKKFHYNNSKGCENVSGNGIWNSKNSFYSFDCFDSENLKFSASIYNGKSSYDYTYWGDYSEFLYECMAVGTKAYNIKYCVESNSDISNVYYSHYALYNTKDCFGCIGIKNKQYCILNKQYTKEEYEVLLPRIIEHMMKTGEWGEFFPSYISPFGYNETIAEEYYPLESSQLSVINKQTNTFKTCKLSTGNGELKVNWSDYEAPFPKVEKIIPASKLPDDISKIPDDILNWAIECEVTKKPFRIIKQELEFYRKHKLPIPRRHPDQRHLDRMKLRNPRKLFERKCDKCGKDIQTTYAPERPEIVYCEECYNKEIY